VADRVAGRFAWQAAWQKRSSSAETRLALRRSFAPREARDP